MAISGLLTFAGAAFAQTPGTILTVAGNGATPPPANAAPGDGGPATDVPLNQPSDVAVDSGGRLFISSLIAQRVRVVTPDGKI